MEEEVKPESIRKLSRAFFVMTVLIGILVNYNSFSALNAFRQLFEGMSLELPVVTKVLLSPLSSLCGPVLLAATVIKEYLFRETPFRALVWNAGLLIAMNLTWVLQVRGVLAPLISLIGNLG